MRAGRTVGYEKRTIGVWGESEAKKYLEKKGMRFIASGFKSRFGEIDIIMRDGATVVFVEVKTRKNRRFAEAREFVSYEKQRRIRMTASLWLSYRGADAPARFDVVEVYAPQGADTQKPEIIHIPNAFI